MIFIAILAIVPAVIVLAYDAGICMIHDSTKADA